MNNAPEEINIMANGNDFVAMDGFAEDHDEKPVNQRSTAPPLEDTNAYNFDQALDERPLTAQPEGQRKMSNLSQRPGSAFVPEPEFLDELVKNEIARNINKKALQKKVLNNVQKDQKQSTNEIRNDFLMYLAKVYNNDARKEGVQGCHRIILNNVDKPEVLRVILGALCDRGTIMAHGQTTSPHGYMFHVQMFGYLAKCFKTELKDPLDKPPSIIKTVARIQETIYTFFKENAKLVWRGCGLSLAEILDNCFPSRTINLGIDSCANLFIDPLLKFLQGGYNKMQQQGASYCIKHLIEHFIANDYQDMIELVHQPILQTSTKYYVDNSEQIAAVIILIDHLGVKVAQNHIDGLITLAIRALKTPNQQNGVKKAACDLLTTLAKNLKSIADLVVPQYQKEVMAALDILASEKLNIVQDARSLARQEWQALENVYNQMDPTQKAKIASILSHKSQSISPIRNPGNKLSMLRDIAKKNKDEKLTPVNRDAVGNSVERKIKFDDVNLSQKYLAQDFLKKGKGQGGGNQSSPGQSKDRRLFDDLRKISELNALMKDNGSPARPATDFKQQLLGMLRPTSSPQLTNLNKPSQYNSDLMPFMGQQMMMPASGHQEVDIYSNSGNSVGQLQTMGGNTDPAHMSPDSQYRMLENERFRLKQQASQMIQGNPNLQKYNNQQNQISGMQQDPNNIRVTNLESNQYPNNFSRSGVRFQDSLEPSRALQLQQTGHLNMVDTRDMNQYFQEDGYGNEGTQMIPPHLQGQYQEMKAAGANSKQAREGSQQPNCIPNPITEKDKQQLQMGYLSPKSQLLHGIPEDPDIDRADDDDINDRVMITTTGDKGKVGKQAIKAPQKDLPIEYSQGAPQSILKPNLVNVQPVQHSLPQQQQVSQLPQQRPLQLTSAAQQNQVPQLNMGYQRQQVASPLTHQPSPQYQNYESQQLSPQAQVPNETYQRPLPSLQQNLQLTANAQAAQAAQAAQSAQAAQAAQIAKIIQQSMGLMQQSMEKGFGALCDKIQTIEKRVDQASSQLQVFEYQKYEENKIQQQKESEHRQLLKKFSETISLQQDQLKRHISKEEVERQQLVKIAVQQQVQEKAKNQSMVEDEKMMSQRDPRFALHDNALAQLPPIQQSFGSLPQQQQQLRSPQRQSKLTQVWMKALELVKKRQYEEAYRLVLRDGDDMYLLRLVVQTGPVVKYLEDTTSISVINRVNKIVRSGVFEVMEIEWIEDAHRRGLLSQLTRHEQNEYLDTLYQFQMNKINPKIKERATDVYQQIKMQSTNGMSKSKAQLPPPYNPNRN